MKRAILGVALMVLATFSLVSISSATMTSKANASAPTIVMPDDLKWAPVNGLTGVQMAVVWGDPNKPGPYIIRLKLVDGAMAPPHWHPDDERATVLSGTFMVGVGDTVDPSKMKAARCWSICLHSKRRAPLRAGQGRDHRSGQRDGSVRDEYGKVRYQAAPAHRAGAASSYPRYQPRSFNMVNSSSVVAVSPIRGKIFSMLCRCASASRSVIASTTSTTL